MIRDLFVITSTARMSPWDCLPNACVRMSIPIDHPKPTPNVKAVLALK